MGAVFFFYTLCFVHSTLFYTLIVSLVFADAVPTTWDAISWDLIHPSTPNSMLHPQHTILYSDCLPGLCWCCSYPLGCYFSGSYSSFNTQLKCDLHEGFLYWPQTEGIPLSPTSLGDITSSWQWLYSTLYSSLRLGLPPPLDGVLGEEP